MKRSITLENMFENDITCSILNLLSAFGKEGLRPLYIRFVLDKKYAARNQINKDPEFNGNIDRITNFFGGHLETLEKNWRIKRDCIKSREQLQYYLKQLGEENLGVIRKKGEGKKVHYIIKEEAYNESRRLQSIESMYIFPRDKFKFFPLGSEKLGEGCILYGLSDNLYDHWFDSKNRKDIENGLNAIDNILERIYRKKLDMLFLEKDKRLEAFLENTKSPAIKKLLRKNKDLIHNVFCFQLDMGRYIGQQRNLLLSEDEFFYTFKYMVRWPDPKLSSEESIKVRNVVKNFVDGQSERDFCISWCKEFLQQQKNIYNLTKSDIEEIVRWGWDNRDFFDLCVPMEIAYVRYNQHSDKFTL